MSRAAPSREHGNSLRSADDVADSGFDHDGLSRNVASEHAQLVEHLHEQLWTAVESWY